MQRITVNKTTSHIGKEVKVAGWVHVRRDHGKLIFIDLRDSSGLLQIVFNNDFSDYSLAEELRPEWVVEIVGEVLERPENMVNKDIATGKVELRAKELHILNKAKTPPFDVTTDGKEIGEENRLKYRYLDLRRERMQRNLKLRSKVIDSFRQFLFNEDFTEIETPYLTKATPEGARDFVVPSRYYPGKFFALPQSPQQYKQLLMIGGVEKYFQIARAFRDEDLRADRGYEHTQIDIEMSFVSRKDVMAMNEEMMISVIEGLGYKIKEKPFPQIPYNEAIGKYKVDRPDLRDEKDKKNGVLAFVWIVDFPFFEKTKEGKWTFSHNPFSSPKEEHLELLLKKESIGEILTSQYDMVCNGFEIGGGSIRSHKPDILKSVLEIMGHSEKSINSQFGHMIEAFSYGAPPHGGIAYGVERILMTLLGESSIREVQAFPQTASGKTSVMNAPSEISKDQLDELGLSIKDNKKQEARDKQ